MPRGAAGRAVILGPSWHCRGLCPSADPSGCENDKEEQLHRPPAAEGAPSSCLGAEGGLPSTALPGRATASTAVPPGPGQLFFWPRDRSSWPRWKEAPHGGRDLGRNAGCSAGTTGLPGPLAPGLAVSSSVCLGAGDLPSLSLFAPCEMVTAAEGGCSAGKST